MCVPEYGHSIVQAMKGRLDLGQFNLRRTNNEKSFSRHPDVGANGQLDELSKKKRKRDVLAGIEKLPTLPNVVHEVIRLTHDPKSKVDDFVSLFSNEQTLTARMLRIANSPFYGMNGKIKTIPKAIVILGYKTLKSLVLASSSTGLFKRGSEEYGFAENGLWLHSVAVARMARHLAKNWFGFTNDVADELFVVGLMHDIGKVLLCQELVKYRSEFQVYAAEQQNTNVADMERAILGVDHCEVGEVIIRKWKIGDEIAAAIRNHHDRTQENSENQRYNSTLILADLLCNEARVGLTPNCRWTNPEPESVLSATGLDQASLEIIREEAQTVFAESAELIDAIG